VKTTKLEVEKKRKRRMSPPPIVETPIIPTPSTREVESDEEDEATDDRWLLRIGQRGGR
jgi:hypothetical protein